MDKLSVLFRRIKKEKTYKIRTQCYRMLESVTSRIVLQQGEGVGGFGFDGAYRNTVDVMISKFAEENEFDQALSDVDQHAPPEILTVSHSLGTIESGEFRKKMKGRE